MTTTLKLWSSVDPRELPINRRFKNSQTVHPRAKAAQRQLADDIIAAMPADFEPCQDECTLRLAFVYPDRRTDIDAAIKRTLDAIQMAIKEAGHQWHDGKIDRMLVSRYRTNPEGSYSSPGIDIHLY